MLVFIGDLSRISVSYLDLCVISYLKTLLLNGLMLVAFDKLIELFISAPIMQSPYWNLPFEIMCDASDFAIGAVLG